MNRKTFFRISVKIVSVFAFISCQAVPSEIPATPDTASPESEDISQTQGDPLTQTPNASSGQVFEGIAENSKIEFWYPFVGEMAGLMDGLINTYNLENEWGNLIVGHVHADQEVLIEDLTGEFQEKGNVPDLIISSSQSLQTWYGNGFSIRALDDLIPIIPEDNEGNGIPQIFPVFWNIDVVNGKRIGIPAYQSGLFLFYNQTWAQDLGFSNYPQSIEDFQAQTCLAEKTNRFDADITNNGTGGWIFDRNSISLLAWMKSFNGGQLINDRLQPILAEEENINAMQFLYDLYNADCAWIGKQPSPYTYFSNRFALLYSGQIEDILWQLQIDTNNGNTDDWKLIPYPSSEGKPVVMVKGLSFAVTTDDDAQAIAALDFVRWMLKPENQQTIIEKMGVFPLSSETINLVDQNSSMFPIWQDSLQFLPYAQPEPVFTDWSVMEKVFEDIGWQLTQFTMQPGKIESMLSDAEKIIGEIKQFDE